MSDAPKPENQADTPANKDAADPLAGMTTLDWADSVASDSEAKASAADAPKSDAKDETAPEAEKPAASPQLPAIVQTLNAEAFKTSRTETVKADAAKAGTGKAESKADRPVRKAPEIIIERPDAKARREAPPVSAKSTIDAAPRVVLAGDRGRPEPKRRSAVWTVFGVAAAASLIVAVAAATTGGAGEEQAAAKADGVKEALSQSEQKLASTEADRKKAEQALAQTNRDLDAKRAELAEEQKKFDALSKQRATLQETALKTKTAALAPTPQTPEPAAPAATETPPAPKPAAIPVPTERPKVQAQKSAPAPAPSSRVDDDRYASLDDRHPMEDDYGSVAGVDRRVFIHIQAGSPSARARGQAIAAELARQGMDVVIRPVPHAVGRDAVRFFYDEDRRSVGMLKRALRNASPIDEESPVTQDFRDYGVLPRPGTMEIWLS